MARQTIPGSTDKSAADPENPPPTRKRSPDVWEVFGELLTKAEFDAMQRSDQPAKTHCECPSRAKFKPRDDGTCPNCHLPFPESIKLHRIGEIKLGSHTYSIAKNGRFTLVDESDTDAWGNPIGRAMTPHDLAKRHGDQEIILDLIDLVGSLVEQVRGFEMTREMRAGAGRDKQ